MREPSPFEVSPHRLREIEIWGTIYKGRKFEALSASGREEPGDGSDGARGRSNEHGLSRPDEEPMNSGPTFLGKRRSALGQEA